MKRLVLTVLLALVAAAAAGYGWLRESLPRTSGTVLVVGLGAPVDVLRDAYGIPHVFARSLEDAQFALGYVHAQDRLWQMEMNRRIGSGRLAEVIGAAGLETDRFMRTLGVRRAAEANLRRYDTPTRRELDAYAAGVNAFLASDPVLPPEFWLLRVKPEPWSAIDSVVWTKMMAWDLGGNWRNELLRMRLAGRLELGAIHEFLAPYPGDAAPQIRDLRTLYSALEKKPDAQPVFSQLPAESGGASNSWALAGARTATGKPLLANDPHLGLTSPAVWYFAHLHAPGLDAIGATLPGVPGILVGRNPRIAWGLTNTGADVQDLYIERLDGPFETRDELIRVRGAADERIKVRVSRHGPVISDVSTMALDATPRGYALALAWTALAEDDLTMQAALRLARAGDWKEFLAAARELHAPPQSVTYADAEGNVGFVAAGRVPRRKPENDLQGLAPAPGWDERYDWAGYLEFEELPQELNPASGEIVAANHKIVPPGYRHHITTEWQPPYRARRIEELLGATPSHSLSSFAGMQLDVVSPAMRELLPRLARVEGRSAAARDAVRRLGAWDGRMSADAAEPLIATAWWREMARALYADELGSAFRSSWGTRAVFVANVLADRDGQSRWCDDRRTRERETCDELLADALEKALADLRRRYGDDVAAWNWGAAHEARSRHRPLSRQPWLARFFDIRVASPGDAYTVNVGRSDFGDEEAPYANRHAASLRAIYDLAEPQASVFIHTGGQSGNPFSPHFRSLAGAWARGDYIRMTTDRAALEAARPQRLVLAPRR